MFIEQLRHVKKKWKVPAMVLICLLVLGLLSSFAFLGSNFAGGTQGNSAASYEDMTKSTAKAVKKDATAANLLAAISAYDDYAAYQVLYLDEEGAKESYQAELDYVNQLFDLYGAQETTDAEWVEAYQAAIGTNLAVGDTEKARALFKESLKKMTLTSDYVSAYTQSLMAKELYTELAEDLNSAAAVVEPLAEAYEAENPAADEEDAAEESEKTTTAEEDTPVTVLEAIQSNLQYAQMMASMYAAE